MKTWAQFRLAWGTAHLVAAIDLRMKYLFSEKVSLVDRPLIMILGAWPSHLEKELLYLCTIRLAII